jgi:hypothetical protein
MTVRDRLVSIVLEWERLFTVAPAITSALSECDAARLVGCNEDDCVRVMMGRTAVSKGADFVWKNERYQIKANRPSGKKGSKVNLVSKAKNYDWDVLIWILYNERYEIVEAWKWLKMDYHYRFESKKHVRPNDMRQGECLLASKPI